MPTGTVAFFNATKGYGFISPDCGGADCFVHLESVEAAGLDVLKARQRIGYRVLIARNGKISAIDLHMP